MYIKRADSNDYSNKENQSIVISSIIIEYFQSMFMNKNSAGQSQMADENKSV